MDQASFGITPSKKVVVRAGILVWNLLLLFSVILPYNGFLFSNEKE